MIDINSAIIQSKNKINISDGGSMCFDFGDVVLVKYSSPIEYLKNGERTREKSEEIMEALNQKADNGVNTPKHLAVKRVIEGEDDICYVLQQKCPGFNCASKCKYGVSFDQMCEDLEFVLNIPFEHYKKLIEDGFQLFEMGYEAKNKNLFYDSESGFWYIDFLDNEKEYRFNQNNVKQVFQALNYRIPNPIRIASIMEYNSELTPVQQQKKNLLKYGIESKLLLAIKEVLPGFQKYEKFLLANESDDYKKYLMKEGIVSKNLMSLDESDYKTFDELYEIVMDGLIDKVVNKGEKFWSIECNDIRNDSDIFKLSSIWKLHRDNTVQRKDFEDDYDYKLEISKQLHKKILFDLINRLDKLNQNENVTSFLSDASEKLQIEHHKK